MAVILGTDGKRKMSKTLGNIISIFEDETVIKKQVMGAYTDPKRVHATDPGHIEGNMVFAYLDFFVEPTEVSELKGRYMAGNVSDVEVKEYLFACLMKTFGSARKEYAKLKANPQAVRDILRNGQEKARAVATQTTREAREAIGLVNAYSIGSPLTVHSSSEDTITIDEFARMEQRGGQIF